MFKDISKTDGSVTAKFVRKKSWCKYYTVVEIKTNEQRCASFLKRRYNFHN